MASRQREYQKVLISQGLCMICAKPRQGYAYLCDSCHAKNRILARNRYRRKHGIPLTAPLYPGRPRRKIP